MSTFVAGHMTKCDFKKNKLWITSFWTQISHLNFKDNVVTFTAHLRVAIKHLTIQAKSSLSAMLEGKSMPSNVVANANHTTLLKNQSAI